MINDFKSLFNQNSIIIKNDVVVGLSGGSDSIFLLLYINGLRFSFYGVSDFNIWISISSMITFLITCVLIVIFLLKRGYNIKS